MRKNEIKEPTNDKRLGKRVTISMLSPVGWFNIRLLIATGIKSLISSLIDSRSPTREVLAALDSTPPAYKAADTAPSKKETWIDYVADIGDGFSATHSISWLLGRDYLFLDEAGKAIQQPIPKHAQCEVSPDKENYKHYSNILPAGSTTIFGGDQVYPVASQQEYQRRTFSPYFAARPWGNITSKKENNYDKRQLYAIPGNHDWYDGLVSFVSRFCQPDRWMGCWQSRQKRSYFSLQLSHGFWLWGIDMATDDDIDPPQLHYFEEQSKQLGKNDQVILCIPKPIWNSYVHKDKKNNKDSRKKDYLWGKIEKLEKLITNNQKINASVAVILAGDQHHYAHHIRETNDEMIPNTHLITCGGGGAYMLGTATIAKDISLPDYQAPKGECEEIATKFHKAFPSEKESNKIKKGVFKLFIHYKIFCTTLAAIFLGLIWLIHTSSARMSLVEGNGISTKFLADESIFSSHFFTVIRDLFVILISNPGVLSIVVLVASIFIVFAFAGKALPSTPKSSIFLIGALHFTLHFFLAIYIAKFLYITLIRFENFFLLTAGFIVCGLLLGWLINGLLLSTYIAFSNYLLNMHEEELYSSQSIEDWKCFLRMRINSEGLTIYPVGLRKTVRRWKVSKNEGEVHQSTRRTLSSWIQDQILSSLDVTVQKGTTHIFEPIDAIKPELIEPPITIPSRKGS